MCWPCWVPSAAELDAGQALDVALEQACASLTPTRARMRAPLPGSVVTSPRRSGLIARRGRSATSGAGGVLGGRRPVRFGPGCHRATTCGLGAVRADSSGRAACRARHGARFVEAAGRPAALGLLLGWASEPTRSRG